MPPNIHIKLMKSLLIATSNAHKTAEIQSILGSTVQVTDLRSLPDVGEIIEDADSFEGNADIKSTTVSRLTSGLVLADDSGLTVQALDGAPGIYSARYAGAEASMDENKALLLQNLQGITARAASFVCVLSIAQEGKVIARFRGECHGTIIEGEEGEGGFGYDPLFIPDGYDQTFAQLPAETKNAISHRALAMEQFQSWMNSQS